MEEGLFSLPKVALRFFERSGSAREEGKKKVVDPKSARRLGLAR